LFYFSLYLPTRGNSFGLGQSVSLHTPLKVVILFVYDIFPAMYPLEVIVLLGISVSLLTPLEVVILFVYDIFPAMYPLEVIVLLGISIFFTHPPRGSNFVRF
jgi:hypothetical protein